MSRTCRHNSESVQPRPPGHLPRAERLRRILEPAVASEASGRECVWCRTPLAAGDRNVSLDHLVPRLKRPLLPAVQPRPGSVAT